MSTSRLAQLFLVPAIVGASVALTAQKQTDQAPPKKTDPKVLSLDDYGKWRRLTTTSIAPSGEWLTFAYDPNDGDTVMFVKRADGSSEHEVLGGSRPAFSEDSRFVAYMIDPPTKKRPKGQPATRACELLELATGLKKKFAGATTFAFAKSGKHLAIVKRRADAKAKHRGADLLLVTLGTGVVQNLGNVAEYAFNESGSQLAYVVDAADQAGNGVCLHDLASGRTVVLDGGAKTYSRLAWSEDRDDLLCLRGKEVEGFEQRANDVLVFRGLPKQQAPFVYAPTEDEGFPDAMVISEFRGPSFSRDGRRVFVGVRQQRKKLGGKGKSAGKSKKRSNVEVWHWRDERLQSVQKVRESRDRRQTMLAVLHLNGSTQFVQLASKRMPMIMTSDHPRYAVGRDDAKYRGDMTADGGRADYYRVDLESGARSLIAKTVRRSLGLSPSGEWFLFSRDGEVFAHEVETGATESLSKLAKVDFTNHQADRPTEKPTYGIAGWAKDGRSILLNHEFDLWQLPLGGSGVAANNLTRGVGAKNQIRFRYVRLDPEAKSIDLGQPLVLSAYGERTKHSGYYRLVSGREPEPLLYAGKMIGSLRKAKHAERFTFTQQSAVEAPDIWLAHAGLGSAKKMSDVNPHQSDYKWTPGRVLIDYTDKRGNKLQATLTLPAGYVKGKRYPTLVYFYEKMSQRHHSYSMPTFDDRPHMATYASDGYMVLMPDIVYEDGKPGTSALDDIGSAVRKAIELGYADPKRVGLQGHSWGGYQSSFIVTQTDMFACVVTGAPLTNLVSMHNVLYKRTGNANAGLIEWGQGRMATNPWANLAAYVEQSPMHHATKIKTPFMILHGTADGAVDWNQGLEFYIAAKRLGKQVILLSYPGEPHHLRQKENQLDFQRRMKQYFDHYLKGLPAPQWLKKGLPYAERSREKR